MEDVKKPDSSDKDKKKDHGLHMANRVKTKQDSSSSSACTIS